MTYYKDLTPCGYFDREVTDRSWKEYLTAVGWLEEGQHYPTGAPDQAFVDRLFEYAESPWEPTHFFGYHTCSFCPIAREKTDTEVFHNGRVIGVGASNIFVPEGSTVYVAPSLVIHYVLVHDYLPPSEFCDALMICPPFESRAYARAMMRVGPPSFKWLEYPNGGSYWRSLVLRAVSKRRVRNLMRKAWLDRLDDIVDGAD